MKINFLGDSITEGGITSSPEKIFVNVVGSMLNCEVRNYGISGTRIADRIVPSGFPRHDLFFGDRVKEMDKDADYVFVFGGTNDYGHGDAPLGELGDKTPKTFYGAMDYLINQLLKYYRKEQIVFIPPLYRIDENNLYGDGSKTKPGNTLPEYRKAMEEVLNKYGMIILDIKDEFGQAENSPLLADGLHPNDAGHFKIAELIVNYINNSSEK